MWGASYDWEKSRKTLVNTLGFQAKIWNTVFRNTKQEWGPLYNVARRENAESLLSILRKMVLIVHIPKG